MKYPEITIRLGANVNEVTVDGHVFDRYRMLQEYRKQRTEAKQGKRKWRDVRNDVKRLRTMIVQAYQKLEKMKGNKR